MIEKSRAFDVRLPFCAVIVASPCTAIRVAATDAVIWFASTNVVDRAVPFQKTVVPAVNPPPFTVRLKAGPPAVADEGERPLSTRGACVITNDSGVGEIWPGADTLTEAVPANAIRLAGIAAVSCVALPKVVDTAEPFHVTAVLAVNPEPFTVSVNPGLPDTTVAGDRPVSAKGACVMTNDSGTGEVWPDCCTSTEAVPASAIKLAGTVTLSCAAETNVVVNDDPFQVIAVLAVNPEPFTVSVNPGLPDTTVAGERLVSAKGARVMMNDSGAGEVWPDCCTSTKAVPARAIKPAGTVALSCAAEMKVVANADPFHVTVVALVKPPPLTRRVNCAPPAAVVFGERLVRVNGGALIVNVAALELRPPVCAVIDAVPGCAIRLAGTIAVS